MHYIKHVHFLRICHKMTLTDRTIGHNISARRKWMSGWEAPRSGVSLCIITLLHLMLRSYATLIRTMDHMPNVGHADMRVSDECVTNTSEVLHSTMHIAHRELLRWIGGGTAQSQKAPKVGVQTRLFRRWVFCGRRHCSFVVGNPSEFRVSFTNFLHGQWLKHIPARLNFAPAQRSITLHHFDKRASMI